MLVDGETARRWTWSQEDKCRIVAETLVPSISVAEVARRHNMNANLLFNWRRETKQGPLPAVPSQADEANKSTAMEFIPIGMIGHDEDTGETALRIPVGAGRQDDRGITTPVNSGCRSWRNALT